MENGSTDLYLRQHAFYEEKRPEPLRAVLRNLVRYIEMLEAQ